MSATSELRDLPDAELEERLDGAKEELFNLRFQLATGQLDNPMRIKQVRHEVARILTILRERELIELEELEDRETGDAPEAPAAEEQEEEEQDEKEDEAS